jgi:hypothetical protein
MFLFDKYRRDGISQKVNVRLYSGANTDHGGD